MEDKLIHSTTQGLSSDWIRRRILYGDPGESKREYHGPPLVSLAGLNKAWWDNIEAYEAYESIVIDSLTRQGLWFAEQELRREAHKRDALLRQSLSLAIREYLATEKR